VRDAWLGPNSTAAQDPFIIESFAEYVASLTEYPWSIVEAAKRSARISCFSETGDNLLMWAHYADGLRGFCVEFDGAELTRGTPAGAEIFKVRYQAAPEPFDLCVYEVAHDQWEWHEDQLFEAQRKRLSIVGDLEDEFRDWANTSRAVTREMYAKLLATKPIEWQYEREIRLIFHSAADDQQGVLFRYPAVTVKSVIIGDKMSDDHRAVLSSALERAGLDVSLSVAKRDPSSFRVIVGAPPSR
jgi:hypothetical protein